MKDSLHHPRQTNPQQYPRRINMKYKSVSTIAAILCGCFLAFVPAFAQENEPEVILTLEGNYKGQVTFVLTGDTVRYEHRTIAPIYPAPTDVTVDGKPWKDLDQPFKLDYTPDFEDVTARGKIDGSKVTLFQGPDRVELTLRDPEGAVRYQMQNPADSDPPAVRATHFAVPLIVKNIHSSSRPVLIPMGPNQIKLQSERERRAELEIALKVLEGKPVTPEISRSRTESIDMLRRQIDDADRNIRRLEELAEKEAALDDLDSDEAKADEDLQKLLEFRNKMEADLQALEQDPAADRKQISQMRQNLLLYDGMLKNARVRLANGAISLKLGPVSSNERDGVTFPPPEAPWQTAARPGSATTQTSGPAASKADVDRKQQDLLAGVPLWNPEQDGPPEIRLRELVNDTAKRAEANLRSIGAVMTTSIDAEHSAADVDFFITDDFRKIVCFIDEIEKTTPRLRWRRVEIRVEPVGGRAFPEEKPKTDARKFRMLGQIRVIRHTPAKKETVPAAGDSASAKEKVKKEPVYPGDPDFLAKLYDLTLALPEEALVTNFRFNNGNCDLTIQTETARIDLERRMVFPYWRIGRMQQRIMADVVSSSVSLVRNDDPARPQKDSVTRADKIDTIVALNIFDPDRTPKKSADSGRPAVPPGSNGTGANSAEPSAAEMERQLEEAVKNHAELDSLRRTLEQTPGPTKEQIELVRQRLERSEQRVKLLQDKLKKLRP
ncbi:MAG: hypothetical protein IKY02_00400 [Lachnospiraceae bacterium]|nr:hypothetical protein [Lachnospiraceae bacterium]